MVQTTDLLARLILFPQQLVEHDLHVLPVGLDGLTTIICQADQGAGDAIDELLFNVYISSLFQFTQID